MKILHTADIHLREYDDDRWKALQELIKVGKKENIEIFVISGDLFDKGISAENLRPKIREIFSNTGFKIVIIPGNHDRDSYKLGFYFGKDIEILMDLNKPFKHKDIIIWGMPYERLEGEEIRNKLRSLAKNLPSDKKNILLYHGELIDTYFSRMDFGDEGEKRYMPIRLSYFKGFNIDYILAGHFHSKFNVKKLENNGYFVYPGSPISITKKEIGQRNINIFEVGKEPQEYPINTPHFEEVIIELDPFSDKKPMKIIKEKLENLHQNAKVILTVKGFINSKSIGMTEIELVEKINDLVKGKCDKTKYEFSDIKTVLIDDLFIKFSKKLDKLEYNEKKKKQMCNTAIRVIMEAQK